MSTGERMRDWVKQVECSDIVHGGDGHIVALLPKTRRTAEREEIGKLIAAAPDLLAVVQKLIPWMERYGSEIHKGSQGACHIHTMARAAIAKATGGGS